MASRVVGRASAAAIGLALLFSCAAQEGGIKRLAAEELQVRRADGTVVSVTAEIAANDADRERGLMYRKSVPDGEGMLFVFESDRRLSFWMKNTTVPLSIAFVSSDGRILEIRNMEPLSLAPVDSERSVRYALEVPLGWFERAGVRIGDMLAIPPRYKSAR
jgi:uncharacterized membrane protein (UPF0127 family)